MCSYVTDSYQYTKALASIFSLTSIKYCKIIATLQWRLSYSNHKVSFSRVSDPQAREILFLNARIMLKKSDLRCFHNTVSQYKLWSDYQNGNCLKDIYTRTHTPKIGKEHTHIHTYVYVYVYVYLCKMYIFNVFNLSILPN